MFDDTGLPNGIEGPAYLLADRRHRAEAAAKDRLGPYCTSGTCDRVLAVAAIREHPGPGVANWPWGRPVCAACRAAHQDREHALFTAIVRAARLGLASRRTWEQTRRDAIAAAGGPGVWLPIYVDAVAKARAAHRGTEVAAQFEEARQVIAELAAGDFDAIDNAVMDAVNDAYDHVLMCLSGCRTAADVRRAEDERAAWAAREAATILTDW